MVKSFKRDLLHKSVCTLVYSNRNLSIGYHKVEVFNGYRKFYFKDDVVAIVMDNSKVFVPMITDSLYSKRALNSYGFILDAIGYKAC